MLSAEAAVAEQADNMATILCPMTAAPDQCANQTRTEWPTLAGVLYTKFLEPSLVCYEMGMCDERDDSLQQLTPQQLPPQLKSGTGSCQFCSGDLFSFAGYILDTNERTRWIEYLQTSDYCGSLSADPNCEEHVPARLPYYLLVLAESIFIGARDTCCQLDEACCD